MTEDTLFKTEQPMDSSDISDYLRKIADKIESEDTVTFRSGEQEFDLDTQGDKEFEVKVEREGSGSSEEISLELEIEWTESGHEDGQLGIE